MTDEALQDMYTGLASCFGQYAYFQNYTDYVSVAVREAASDCALASALTPLSLNTCVGAITKIGEMSSCGEEAQTGGGGGGGGTPRTPATCATDACVGFMSSMTDDALQDMTTGFASCTGMYAMYQMYSEVQLRGAVLSTASECDLTSALTPPTTCDFLAACNGEELGTVGVSAACYQAVGGVIQSGLAPASWEACNNAQQATVPTACKELLLSELAACPAPSPPTPPEMPGTSFVEAVVFKISVTAAGTVDAFDKTGFETSMRSYLGCNAPLCQVAIAVTAGSVNVVATVTDSTSTAVAAAAKLTTDPTAALSTALGVTVEAAPTVSAATETKLIVRTVAPSVAPSPPQSGSELRMGESRVVVSENGLSGGAIASIVVSCMVSAALMIGVAVLLKKTLQLPRPEEVTVPSLVKPEQV
eukprot:scaffold100410_cov67-Phaeocystis_antarctica.AAC.1